ncbi:MAG: DUF2855 family protein [Betaproteobacteria bacterium]|nr:DUF2855 family protein [Betaproteobacteria bacterium]
MSAPQTLDFQIRKTELSKTRLITQPQPDLQDRQVLLQIESFALTSNNITYAAFGDAMNYWGFYPVAPESGEATSPWGRIPVWGFATVTESRTEGIAVGEKFYGYYPMASSVVLTPTRVSPTSFVEAAPHRAALAAVYNQYVRCSADPFYTPDTENVQSLLRPLFITSWLIDDFLADNAFFGTTAPGKRPVMLLSSASSKTAYGTAFQLTKRPEVEVVGLTSPGNLAFCQSLGCYSRVLCYDQLDQIATDTPMVYVDFAGNADLRRAVHTRFTALAYSSSIGGTHVSELGGKAKNLPGPRATLFFAPAQIKKRAAEWGGDGLGQRLVAAWKTFSARVSDPASPWMVVEQHQGADAVQAAYAQVLGGRGDPRVGHVLSMNA